MKTAEMERLLGELKDALLPLTGAVLERSGAVDDSFLYDGLRRPAPAAGGARDPAADADRARHVAPGRHRAPVRDRLLPHRRAHHDPLQRRQPLHRRLLGAARDGARPLRERRERRHDCGLRCASRCHSACTSRRAARGRTWSGAAARFWRCFHGVVARTFPERLEGIGPDDFYRAVNKVRASLVRVDADELTYDLHVLVRFELERAMFAGALDLADLPEAWNERDARIPRHRRAERLRRRAAGRALGGGPVRLLPDVLARQHHRRAAVGGRARGAARPRGAASSGASSRPCASGCASTSTGTGASSSRRRSWSARPAGRSRSARTCATCARSTARSTGSRQPRAPRRGPSRLRRRGRLLDAPRADQRHRAGVRDLRRSVQARDAPDHGARECRCWAGTSASASCSSTAASS